MPITKSNFNSLLLILEIALPKKIKNIVRHLKNVVLCVPVFVDAALFSLLKILTAAAF